MKKVLHIVGARPQFIKVNVVIKASNFKKKKIKNFLLHTGQHYDRTMSEIFFRELKIKKPDYHINIKKKQDRLYSLSKMIIEIAKVINELQPKLIVIYGDTDSTLAGAISARKKNIKLIHVESGMRSYDLTMPEEQNRLVADKLSNYFVTVSKDSTNNLLREGVNRNRIFEYGDVMFDSLQKYKNKIKKNINTKNSYIFFTLHRDSNSKYKILKKIFKDISKSKNNFIWPVHPKISKLIKAYKLKVPKNLVIYKPISYIQTLTLISNSKFVVTDSGGVLREAYFLKKKIFIMRNEIEWPELIKNKSSMMIGYNLRQIELSKSFMESKIKNFKTLGDGRASLKIANLINRLV